MRLPLITHASSEAVVAYRGGRPITAASFLADVERLTVLLPDGRHVLNACADRYRFAVTFAAVAASGRVNLLPPTLVPEVLRHLRDFAPDAICVTDETATETGLPTVHFPGGPAPAATRWQVPAIDAAATVAVVFTSGSTGTPLPHAKTWGRLAGNVDAEAERLGLADGTPYALLATVPPQHMYGFETSVLMPLRAGLALCAERPFYPADIVAALAALPPSRVLVSTPIHLRALLAAELVLPAVARTVCATAPLETALAAEVERRLAAPLLEIYGATETGQLASRRTTAGGEWQLWPGVELSVRDGRTWAQGGHVELPTALGDVLEITGPGRFVLCGRNEDLVNIAGKRNSLANLNHQLTAIPGVVDGAFFVRDEQASQSAGGTARLGAVVVAPGLTAAAILTELRARLDPVFLPRPLLLVDAIPRNSTGKLPRAALQSFGARG